MLTNSKVYLYLSELDYEIVGPLDSMKFTSVINSFNNNGNVRTSITKVFIPFDKIAKDFNVNINANIDYALVIDKNSSIKPSKPVVNDLGELTNGSDLIRQGVKIITHASKKNYGSADMQHYYLEIE